jgi:hypothetical protein
LYRRLFLITTLAIIGANNLVIGKYCIVIGTGNKITGNIVELRKFLLNFKFKEDV